MKETIGVIGQGFVGSAVREGMQNHFNVLAYDKDPNKFSNVEDAADIIKQAEVIFVCVPTPMRKSGECDLSILSRALEDLDTRCALEGIKRIVVIKSTIPPGTTERMDSIFRHIHVTFNPEFLTEANAVEDYKNQNRIIVGGQRPYTSTVKRIFAKAFPAVPIIKTSSTIAETIKYVTNTFLSMKVSYANEIYALCQGLDIDYDKVVEYARYDARLGNSHWSVPGPDGDFGYGGHCFPKDIAALQHAMKSMNLDTTMLSATIHKNDIVRTDLDWLSQKGRAVSEE